MNTIKEFRSVIAMVMVLMMVACSGRSISMAEAPVFPGASELKAGDNAIATTLANNEQQAKALGAKIEQKGFALPKDADWAKVKGFYTDKLKSDGWSEGVGGGGIGGGVANDIVNKALSQASSNDLFQTALFSKGTQTLSVIRLVDPVKKDTFNLLLSLSTR